MLDAFIIERIRQQQVRQQEERARGRLPLEIRMPEPPPARIRPPEASREDRGPERGVVDIDFTI